MNRAVQCFLRDTYGAKLWADVASDAGLDPLGFEAMLVYDDALTDAMLLAAERALARPRDAILEDVGTYLVTHANTEALRRILRFGGATFVDFLHSLDELPDRARLAVPEFDFPELELRQVDAHKFRLTIRWPHAGFGAVLTGLLRTLADDYGALVLLDAGPANAGVEELNIHLLDVAFADGRRFDLATGV